METVSPPPFTLRQTSAALLIGSAALLMIGLQPILLGELVEKGALSMEGVGVVAMGEIVTLGLGVALGDAVLPVGRHKLIAVVAAFLVAALDAATTAAVGDGEFAAVRAAAGLAEGVLVWVAAGVIVRARKPDRLAAVFVVAQTLSQAGMAALLAAFILPHGGWQDGFHVLGAVVLACPILALFLPHRLAPLAERSANRLVWSGSAVLPLAVAFLQMAAIGSLWAYMEPLGMSAGFDAQGAQALIAHVLFMQVAGGIAAVWLVRRLRVVATLAGGGVMLAVVSGGISLLPAGAASSTFALLCAVFGFVWLFLMPFHLGLAFRADGRGRVAMLIPAAQLLGSAFGPLVASLAVSGDGAGSVPLVSLGFAVGALALTALGGKRWVGSEPMPSEAFTGKVVLLVGASSGMGRATALRLADEGAIVVATARRKDRLDTLASEIARRGGHCLPLAADATEAAAAAGVVSACVAAFGRIDLVLLNAGGAPALDMRELGAEDVTACMRANYDTVVNYLFPVLKQMVVQRGGVVAHTNSLAGFLGIPLQGPYSAAKGALRLLFDTCRIEFAPYGIRFVSLYPGFVATEATANDGMPAPLEISEDRAVDHILHAIRQQRMDYLFPLPMNVLVRVAAILPKPLLDQILRSQVPSMSGASR